MAQTMTIHLNKGDSPNLGFRLQGGVDFAAPIVIQKVFGSVKKKEQSLQIKRKRKHDQLDSLKRFKRSDVDLGLPEGFSVGEATADGSCFFDSFRQGLQQLNIQVTVEELRITCRDFAQNDPPEWFVKALWNSYDNYGVVRRDSPESYVRNIMRRDRWGDSNVEGRVLCGKYGVRLHVIEVQVVDGEEIRVEQMVDGEGGSSVSNVDYSREGIVHMVNKGTGHFQPVVNEEVPLRERIQQLGGLEHFQPVVEEELGRRVQPSRERLQQEDLGSIEEEVIGVKSSGNKRGQKNVQPFIEKKAQPSREQNPSIEEKSEKKIIKAQPSIDNSVQALSENFQQLAEEDLGGLEHFEELGGRVQPLRELAEEEFDDYGDDLTPEEELINAVKSSDSEALKISKINALFENKEKPDVNFKVDGDTPLHIAVRKNDLQVIETLLQYGARIDVKNSKNRTPLEVAKLLKRQEIVRVLTQGVNLQSSSNKKVTTGQKKVQPSIEGGVDKKVQSSSEKRVLMGQNKVQPSTEEEVIGVEKKLQRSSEKKTVENAELNLKLKTFVEDFVAIYEKHMSEYFDRLEHQIEKPGKLADFFNKLVETGKGGTEGIEAPSVKAPSVVALNALQVIASGLGNWYNRKKLKKLLGHLYLFKADPEGVREELIRAGIEIFRMFEYQFHEAKADGSWERGLRKLAEDVVNRVIDYHAEEFSVEEIVKGVLLGKSKKYKQSTGIPHLKPGHSLNDGKWNTASMFEKAGLFVNGRYYARKDGKSNTKKYGYRLGSPWETLDDFIEEPAQVAYEYVLKRDAGLEIELLEAINANDPALMETRLLNAYKEGIAQIEEDIAEFTRVVTENFYREITKTQTLIKNVDRGINELREGQEDIISAIKNNAVQVKKAHVWFDVRPTVVTFTGREDILNEIAANIRESFMVIAGLDGMGKSEVAIKFAHDHAKYYANVVWIDAGSEATRKESFTRLAEAKLNIRVKDNVNGDDKSVDTVVEDVYAYFGDSKTLFIFDNAEGFSVMEKYLPLKLSPNTDKPHVLITSPVNSGWDDEIRVKVRVLGLGALADVEAVEFVQKVIPDSIEEDVKRLVGSLDNYILVLQQSVAYIKDTDKALRKRKMEFTISDFLKKYADTPRKMLSVKLPHAETILKMQEMTLERMKSRKDSELALRMLNIIAYFSSNHIPESIFLHELAGGSQEKLMGVTGMLEEYSLVTVEEGMLSLNGLVQQVRRLELVEEGAEEEVLARALRLLKDHIIDRNSAEQYMSHVVTAWEHAVKYTSLIERFISGNAGFTSYFHLISEGCSYEVVRSVISEVEKRNPKKLEAIITARDKERGTPLHNAALRGALDIVRLLVEKGANVNHKKKHNWTALHYAAKNGYSDIVEYLLESNADFKIRTGFKYTALHLAARNGYAEIVTLLIEKGADINAGDQRKYTPLHHAVKNDHLEVVKALLERAEININAETQYKSTPLEFAAKYGYLNIVKALLAKGANINTRDLGNFTPLHLASFNNHLQTVEELLRNPKINTHIKTTEGKTALDLAKTAEVRNAFNRNAQIQTNYNKRSGTSGMSGQLYEIQLAMLFLLEAQKHAHFHLASNMDEAEDFDDVIFKNENKIIFLQAKHKDNPENAREKITIERLLSDAQKKDQFTLKDYFSCFRNIKRLFHSSQHPIFSGDFNNCAFVIYTNALPHRNFNEQRGYIKKVALAEEDIMNFSGDNHYYALVLGNDAKIDAKIIRVLGDSAECRKLARELVKIVFEGKPVNQAIVAKYALAGTVVDVQNKGFSEGFISGAEGLLENERIFREVFYEEAEKRTGYTRAEIESTLRKHVVKMGDKFGALPLPSDVVQLEEIREFLSKLQLFIEQPNVDGLVDITKERMQVKYGIQRNDLDGVFSSVRDKIQAWWKDDNAYITEDNAFFDSAVRVGVWWEVKSAVSSFTGRIEELSALHKKIQRGVQRVTVISQITSVSGLGGIGKTELARRYIEEHGADHYDSNVVWINAESEASLTDSFMRFARDKLLITTTDKLGKEKHIKSIVEEVYAFFEKRKSLFVFDNAENAAYLRTFLPLTKHERKIYILITSRVSTWEKGIEKLDLHELKLEEAVEFIRSAVGVTSRELAEKLQCFPLALQQAVAYIEQQNAARDFSVADYLEKFETKTKELLNSDAFKGIDNDYAKTTFTTWQITIDKIRTEEFGEVALRVLECVAYLAHDGIRRDMFSNLARGDEDELISSVGLLLKYSMLRGEDKQRVLSVHRLVQEVTRIELKSVGREEAVLEEVVPMVEEEKHVESVWKHASMYARVVNEFYSGALYGEYENTPLHLLARSGEGDAVERILRALVDVEHALLVRNKKGRTLLHVAAIGGYQDVVELIIESERSVNPNLNDFVSVGDADGSTPLHYAAFAGNERIVEALIREVSSERVYAFITAEDSSGTTPLHLAATDGHARVIARLIHSVPRVNLFNFINAKDDEESTPLHLAAFGGFEQAIAELLAGADGLTRDEFFEVLSAEDNRKSTPLHLAASEGHENAAGALIKAAGSVKRKLINAVDKNTRTPLHVAAREGHERVVSALIASMEDAARDEFNAFISARDVNSDTPLHLAAKKGATPIVALLIKHAEDVYEFVKAGDSDGFTPLHYAAMEGHAGVVNALIASVFNEQGITHEQLYAFFKAQDATQSTPLHLASLEGHTNIVNSLIFSVMNIQNLTPEELYNFIHAVDASKITPLHLAAVEGHTAIVYTLVRSMRSLTHLEMHNFINAQDSEGITPLHLAIAEGHVDIAKILIANKADLNIPDNNGSTPLSLAQEENAEIYEEIIKLIPALECLPTGRNKREVPARECLSYWEDVEKMKQTDTDAFVDYVKGSPELLKLVNKGKTFDYIKDLLEVLKASEEFNKGRDGISEAQLMKQTNKGSEEKLAKKGSKDILEERLTNKGIPEEELANKDVPEEQHVQLLKIANKGSKGVPEEGPLLKLANKGSKDVSEEKQAQHLKLRNKGSEEKITQFLKLQNEGSEEIPEETLTQHLKLENTGRDAQFLMLTHKGSKDIPEEKLTQLLTLENKGKVAQFLKLTNEGSEDIPEEKLTQHLKHGNKGNMKLSAQLTQLIKKLNGNKNLIAHLNKVAKFSTITMHTMMAKNVLSSLLNSDYEGVAINIGFIAGGQAFSKIAQAASTKSFQLASEGKVMLGRSLRAASPFLARGTSAFVVYDLINQVKQFRNGSDEALVGVVGDGIYLGVDVAEIGVEVAEGFEVLEGVSTITGPIGAAIGAVVFVGSDVYMAVKRVDRIDRFVHLRSGERFIEGVRAFIGMQPETYVEGLIEEKEVNARLVREGLVYLKQHSGIQRYVFPTGRSVTGACRTITYKTSECASGGLGGGCVKARVVNHHTKTCDSEFRVDSDNSVLLEQKRSNVVWSRVRPDEQNGAQLFCFPLGDYEPAPSYASYLCEHAIGLTDLSKHANTTLINLKEGEDYAKGFTDTPNIFVVNNGNKRYYGGDADDAFILQGSAIEGILCGRGGVNTLDLSALDAADVDLLLDTGDLIYHPAHILRVFEMDKVIAREGKPDRIFTSCTTLYLDGNGGTRDNFDLIIIQPNCNYNLQITLRAYTTVINNALNGDFHYRIPNITASANIEFPTHKTNSTNTFYFESDPTDIKSITVKPAQTRFNFQNFNITISGLCGNPTYRIGNETQIKLGKNGNVYMLATTYKPASEIITKYARVNNVSFFIHSLLKNETIAIGTGNHEVLHNDPLHVTHLVGNGGENVYVINPPASEVVIHDLDSESTVDTIDLRNFTHCTIQIKQAQNDLLLVDPACCTVRLKNGVDWYKKTHVITGLVPMRIAFVDNAWALIPQPLIFGMDKEIIVITSGDVEENTVVETLREAGDYIFMRDGEDLIVSNAFNARGGFCTVVLKEFYEVPKMGTLSIKFADKVIVLRNKVDEINAAERLDVLKQYYEQQVDNDGEILVRQVRSTSSSTRLSSWINSACDWMLNRLSGLLDSKLTSSSTKPCLQTYFKSTSSEPQTFSVSTSSDPQTFSMPTASDLQTFSKATLSYPQTFSKVISSDPQPFSNATSSDPQTFSIPTSSDPQIFSKATPSDPQTLSIPTSSDPQTFSIPTSSDPQNFSKATSSDPQTFSKATSSDSKTFSIPTSSDPQTFSIPTSSDPQTFFEAKSSDPQIFSKPTSSDPQTFSKATSNDPQTFSKATSSDPLTLSIPTSRDPQIFFEATSSDPQTFSIPTSSDPQTFSILTSSDPQTFSKAISSVPQTFSKATSSDPQTFSIVTLSDPQTFSKATTSDPQTFTKPTSSDLQASSKPASSDSATYYNTLQTFSQTTYPNPTNNTNLTKIDINSTLLLLDLLIRKASGVKHSSFTTTLDEASSLPLCHALNIMDTFESVLYETAVQSGTPAECLNLDFLGAQSAILQNIRNGEARKISTTLYSFAEEACEDGVFLANLKESLKQIVDYSET